MSTEFRNLHPKNTEFRYNDREFLGMDRRPFGLGPSATAEFTARACKSEASLTVSNCADVGRYFQRLPGTH
jgi:hypothetical protein